MGRSRRIWFGALLGFAVGCLWPALALAGTYTWSLPHDFPSAATSSSLSGPDSYGGTPWAYLEAAGAFGNYGSTSENGQSYTGWIDSPNSVFVATGGSSSSDLWMQPVAGKDVAVRWTAPAGLTGNVNITSSIADEGSGVCSASGITWSMPELNQSGVLAVGQSSAPGGTLTVSPGSTITLDIAAHDSVAAAASCHLTAVTLQITFATATPAPTLNTPSSASATPTFSGSATDGFGYSSTVTVNVSGPTSETLPATRSGTAYSVTVPASSPLQPGSYTATATQTDAAGDSGTSSPVSFTVPASGGASSGGTSSGGTSSSVPTVTLDAPGSEPVLTGYPTLQGTAGTAPGDSGSVEIVIFPGTSASGTPYVVFPTQVRADGTYSQLIYTGLPDGTYTAYAGQWSDAGAGYSSTITFTIDATPPALSIDQPRRGSIRTSRYLTISGRAGTEPGDSPTVTVYFLTLSGLDGVQLGRRVVPVHNGHWSWSWPRRLGLGLYTVVTTQSDVYGHAAVLQSRFLVVPPAPRRHGHTSRR